MGRYVSGRHSGSDALASVRPPQRVYWPAWKGGAGVTTHGGVGRYPVPGLEATRMMELTQAGASILNVTTGSVLGSTTHDPGSSVFPVVCHDQTTNQIHQVIVRTATVFTESLDCEWGFRTAPIEVPPTVPSVDQGKWRGPASFAVMHGSNIRLFANGYRHEINPTSGAIVHAAQRHALADGTVLTGFTSSRHEGLDPNPTYITAANDAAIRLCGSDLNFVRGDISIIDRHLAVDVSAAGSPMPVPTSASSTGPSVLLLGDVLAFHPGPNDDLQWAFYDRADFDRWVHDVIDAIKGMPL